MNTYPGYGAEEERRGPGPQYIRQPKTAWTRQRQIERNRARIAREPMPPGHRKQWAQRHDEEDARRRAERVRWVEQCRQHSRAAERANTGPPEADGPVALPVPPTCL